jgi:hypothetical protein
MKAHPHSHHRSRLWQSLLLALILIVIFSAVFLFRALSPPACAALRDLSAPGTGFCWAVIGTESGHLAEQRAAGVQAKVYSLSWRRFNPAEGQIDQAYVTSKREELASLRAAGFAVFLSLGVHDTPKWLHDAYPNSHYINQYGELYQTGEIDDGDANLVFNQELRGAVADYIHQVFNTFGHEFAAVRLGGGRYGELTYPPAVFGGRDDNYWAYDANAQTGAPLPGWRPGDSADSAEIRTFLDWYHGALVDFQTWQIATVRRDYPGPLMMLYPSWGMRPGDLERAIDSGLDGSSRAERNGEIQRGFDFARQIAAINDPLVIVTTTWLDADGSGDQSSDQRLWSPVKYLASLVGAHPLRLRLYGENTGKGDRAAMEFTVSQMRKYNLIGVAWYRDRQLFDGTHATLNDYRDVIRITECATR